MQSKCMSAATLIVAVVFATEVARAGDSEGVSLTIYSSAEPGGIPATLYQPALQKSAGMGYRENMAIPGYAQVRQQRKVALKQGAAALRFTDVAALIEPTTVMFNSLTDPATSVLEQSFEFDLVSPDKLLDRYIDRMIRVTHMKPDGNRDVIDGTLLSAAQGKLILGGGEKNPLRILAGEIESIELAELPGGLITRPTLVWSLNSPKGGDQLVRVTYQTQGMTWWADYNVLFTDDARDANRGTLDVGAWVSIINQSGATYPDARLKLIAGDVQRIEPQQNVYLGMASRQMPAAAPEPQFAEKAFLEYHLYTLQRPTTIPQNSTKQIELFPQAHNVPCEKLLVYDGAPVPRWWGSGLRTDRELGIAMNTKVGVYLRFKNDEQSGMGMPLPSGRVRVSKLDPADASLEFVGEDAIDHTPRGEKVLLKIGSAFDVVGERRQTDFQLDTNRHRMDESFEIKVRNHKDAAVKVVIKESLIRCGEWHITKKSHDFEKQDVHAVHFPVEIAKDGEAVVTYTVRYEW
ncbi:MAG: DUF4139 domain-containing protein [Phycisphaerae bacterium]